MRPRLASLALLLLALCRLSFAEDPSSMIMALAPATQLEALKQAIQRHLSTFSAVERLYWETVTPGQYEAPSDYWEKSMDNGVLCDLADPDFAATIKKSIYGTSTPDATKEKDLAEKFNITCDTPAPTDEGWKCFCQEPKQVFVYCAALKYKQSITAAKTTCANEALATIKSHSTLLAENLELTDFTPPKIAEVTALAHGTDPATMTKNEDAEMAKFYCAAIDHGVADSAVKALYASDLLYAMAAERTVKDLSHICNDPQRKESTTFFRCVCNDGNSADFCMYKAQGKFFEEDGYLICSDAKKKFDKTKRPGAFDVQRQSKKDEISEERTENAETDRPAPTTQAPKVEEITEGASGDLKRADPPRSHELRPEPSAAATSSLLLLLPLSAAAALLLAH